jgi:hypothetical protein
MKRLLIFLLILCGSAAATTRTAASCSASDVQTTINASTDGDTVLLPASTSCATLGAAASWTSNVNITTGITLNGQGAYVNIGTGGALNVTADAIANTVIENFNFGGGFRNGDCPVALTSTLSTDLIRFTGNTFTDPGTAGGPITQVCTGNYGPTLIDHNTFTEVIAANEVIHILGPTVWSGDFTPGTATMVYIETNTFTESHSAADPCKAEEAFQGTRFVFRYNTLDYCWLDAHDGGNGARWYEIYQNQYIFPAGSNNLGTGQLRGGSGLVYSNHIQSGSPGGWSVGPDCPTSSDTCTGTWPVQYQVGRGINGTTWSPLYIWGNDSGIQSNTGPSGSQSLVYVGTALTDASNCSAHTSNDCDAVLTTSLPTLTKCQSAADVTAGCPNTFTYTALAYPYPLGGQAQAQTPSLSPGTGTYTGTQTVTITSGTSGAIICWATGATTPVTNGSGTGCTTGTQLTNGGTISVSSTQTVNAVAGTASLLDSSVGSANYTINTIPVDSPPNLISILMGP